jgi:hypothetical protein
MRPAIIQAVFAESDLGRLALARPGTASGGPLVDTPSLSQSALHRPALAAQNFTPYMADLSVQVFANLANLPEQTMQVVMNTIDQLIPADATSAGAMKSYGLLAVTSGLAAMICLYLLLDARRGTTRRHVPECMDWPEYELQPWEDPWP